ncbi:MAG: fumarylacetoacetate hydrolase family protein [Woeseiaceae bacterium]|nr:fumarylacetoacetate hydrolase family protein [Woeseiaceae bacterium]
MKLASYISSGRPGFGVVIGDGLIECSVRGVGHSLKQALAADALDQVRAIADRAAPDVSINDVTLLPPVVKPGKVFCIGVNYRKHVLEMGRDLPEHPWVFTRSADSFVGHGGDMLCPAVSEQFDFEGELALVIGKTAHRVNAAAALDYVAGYCCLNDGSIRDYQRHSGQFTAGKNFWRSGAIGPWLVSADEVGDPAALQLETRLNGEVMQSAPTSDLIFDVPTLIEYCSTFARLEPGDIIATGTPGGVGAARQPPVWLRGGDTIEISISGIGTLTNSVVDE